MRDYNLLHENFKAVQAENYQLRDYIINLQSRLLESQGEVPPMPGNISLQDPARVLPDHLHHHIPAPTAPMAPASMSQLQASAAQAINDLGDTRRRSGPYDPRGGHDILMQDRTDPHLAVSGVAQTAAPSIA